MAISPLLRCHGRETCPNKKPPGYGSWYYNYKGMFSIVLLAIVNANYEFLLADVGTNGRISDGGVIRNTEVYELLNKNTPSLTASKYQ